MEKYTLCLEKGLEIVRNFIIDKSGGGAWASRFGQNPNRNKSGVGINSEKNSTFNVYYLNNVGVYPGL